MLFKRLGMYIFYTSQGIAVIDGLSCQLFDLLKDRTKNSGRGKDWEVLPDQKNCLLTQKPYPSSARFWISAEFNRKRGQREKEEKKKKVVKPDKREKKQFIVLLIAFTPMSCPIIQTDGSPTNVSYRAMNIWCTGILLSLQSQIFQWIIHKSFRETHFSMILGTDSIIFHTRLND